MTRARHLRAPKHQAESFVEKGASDRRKGPSYLLRTSPARFEPQRNSVTPPSITQENRRAPADRQVIACRTPHHHVLGSARQRVAAYWEVANQVASGLHGADAGVVDVEINGA